METPEHIYVLVTGANSGVGLNVCYRLIDDFLTQKPFTTQLTIIFTTRSPKKGADTLTLLGKHLARARQRHASAQFQHQVHFLPQNVELTSVLSVRQLAYTLLRSQIPYINAIILNAGMIGLTGLDWPLAIWTVMTDTVNALTWPRFKLPAIGLVTQPQLQSSRDGLNNNSEPPMGQVFASNVFGHYLLAHWLTTLLRRCCESNPGRIIWVSSIECAAHHFDPYDIQGFQSPTAYEHSKRLTDILALTAHDQPSTLRAVRSFLTPSPPFTREDPSPNDQRNSEPEIHVVQPGICVTAMVPVPWLQQQGFILMAYLSRLLGSPWALITAYNGAFAISWLALATNVEVEHKKMVDHVGVSDGSDEDVAGLKGGNVEEVGGAVKWGSSATVTGKLSVRKTEVEWWGISGSGEPYTRRWWGGKMGRRSGAREAKPEDVERFVEDGARAWREMEALRKDWEGRLDVYDRLQQGE